MPRPYPPEFRARAIALVRVGKQAKQTAVELGIHPLTLSKWLHQDDIDNGRRPGRVSEESAEPRAARRRIREPGAGGGEERWCENHHDEGPYGTQESPPFARCGSDGGAAQERTEDRLHLQRMGTGRRRHEQPDHGRGAQVAGVLRPLNQADQPTDQRLCHEDGNGRSWSGW